MIITVNARNEEEAWEELENNIEDVITELAHNGCNTYFTVEYGEDIPYCNEYDCDSEYFYRGSFDTSLKELGVTVEDVLCVLNQVIEGEYETFSL